MNRRKGLYGKMKGVMLRNTAVVRALNFWTKASGFGLNKGDGRKQSISFIKVQGEFNPVAVA